MNSNQRCQIYVNNNLDLINRDKNRKDKPANAGNFWSSSEDRKLRDLWNKAHHVHEIAYMHGRSELAINCRLIKLGILDENLNERAGQPLKEAEYRATAKQYAEQAIAAHREHYVEVHRTWNDQIQGREVKWAIFDEYAEMHPPKLSKQQLRMLLL